MLRACLGRMAALSLLLRASYLVSWPVLNWDFHGRLAERLPDPAATVCFTSGDTAFTSVSISQVVSQRVGRCDGLSQPSQTTPVPIVGRKLR